jgi:hypothetical protein
MTILRSERATVRFFDGLSIDGYRMPDGEFRVSLTGASVLLGFSKEWLGRILSKNGNPVKALQGMGFTGQIKKAATRSIRGGGDSAQTISIRDLNALILYAATKGKPQAIALQMALTDMALTDFFRDAFGMRPLDINEKRARFYAAFAATLTPADWRAWDRDDVTAINEHLMILGE